jgi:nucleotide-binding universal stress UspA family protein
VCGISISASGDDGISVSPVDLDLASRALELAAKVDGEIAFVHVVDWLMDGSAADSVGIVTNVREALNVDLRGLTQQAEALGVRVEQVFNEGKPWRELLRFAREWEADVIAVSPHREMLSVPGRIFHGSTTTRVLKHSPIPVWVVTPGFQGVARILALVDQGPASAKVIEATRALAEIYGAERYALSCLAYPDDMALHRLPSALEAIHRYHREVRDDAHAALTQLVGEDERGKWELLLGDDWVVRLAPKVIADKAIDLVVLGGISKPRLAGALLGTTAQRLLERVAVSTWVVRPDGRPEPD